MVFLDTSQPNTRPFVILIPRNFGLVLIVDTPAAARRVPPAALRCWPVLLALGLTACCASPSRPTPPPLPLDGLAPTTAVEPPLPTLPEVRKGYSTKVHVPPAHAGAAAAPPPSTLELVRYAAPLGPLPAYVTPKPKDGARHPAIVWLLGGVSNGIGDVWSPQPRENDQSAKAFRDAGLVVMYPARRGGNDDDHPREVLYGEVDDVLAATAHLAKLDYGDPARIYLGGHSTGGTLALLAAEMGGPFRAVIAFGPVADVRGYGRETFPSDDDDEAVMRSPGAFVHCIHVPTLVVEGARGNASQLPLLEAAKGEAPVTTIAARCQVGRRRRSRPPGEASLSPSRLIACRGHWCVRRPAAWRSHGIEQQPHLSVLLGMRRAIATGRFLLHTLHAKARLAIAARDDAPR